MHYLEDRINDYLEVYGPMRTTNRIIEWLIGDIVWAKSNISKVDKELLLEFAKKIQEV